MISYVLAALCLAAKVTAFAPPSTTHTSSRVMSRSAPSVTSLNAIGALAKKAKQAELRKYVENGIDDAVMEKYNLIKEALANEDFSIDRSTPGPLQQSLTKRKGTITIIAEYKRKNDVIDSGTISEFYDPEFLSPLFRECGCTGIAVMADERMGGCNYDDLAHFIEEQRRAKNNVPGPVSVINNDLIIDELQIARSAAMGVAATVVNFGLVGEEQCELLLKASKAVDLETIVSVSSQEEAQKAVDLGARMIMVVCLDEPDYKNEIVTDLNIPEGQQICYLANILTRRNKQLEEIEDAWALRDKGFNCVWVGDALYKAGNDAHENPANVIKAMKSKSSLKWASPKARSGKGEGAREYLGDIMM